MSDDSRGIAALKTLIEEILRLMREEAVVSLVDEDEAIMVNIKVPNPAHLIGREGRAIEALQYIVQRIGARKIDELKTRPVVIDIDGYRQKRKDELSKMAKEIAQRVSETGRSVLLGPMTAWERKAVHMAIRERKDVMSESEESDAGRRVRIRHREEKDEIGEGGSR